MDKNQRIKLAVKWLITNGVAKNQEGLGRTLGYRSKSAFSQVLNGKVALPNDFIDRLCSLSESLNKDWIETGSGSITEKSNKINEPENNYNIICSECRKKDETISLLTTINRELREKLSEYEGKNKQVV